MRRKDRQQTEEFAWQVADAAPFACLSLVTPEGEAYQVPISPAREGNCFYFHCALQGKKIDCLTANPKVCLSFVTGVEPIPDQDPQDNHISFCLDLGVHDGTLRGQSVDLTLETIVDRWWSDPGTDDAVLHEGDVTGAIMDHAWVFEDVALDFPDQAVRLTPELEIPYRDGTATLTEIEITPLTTTVRIEGGSCYDHHGRAAAQQSVGSGDIVIDAGSAGSVTITDNPQEDISTWFECWDALETTLVMKDGTILEPPAISGGTSCQDGVSNDTYKGVPYVEEKSQYAENSNLIPPRVIDPSQVDYILVCGVRIDMPQ